MQGHNCADRWCQVCRNYHNPKRGCYIQPLEPLDNKKPYKLVIFDLETQQHLPADPEEPTRRVHEPNFISAIVCCQQCIGRGNWRQSLEQPCAICGPHRRVTFSQRPFRQTTVDRQVIADRPLVPFVEWLVFGLPRKYDTYAYSHFGGRFDMVIVFKELFRRGFNPDMLRRVGQHWQKCID